MLNGTLSNFFMALQASRARVPLALVLALALVWSGGWGCGSTPSSDGQSTVPIAATGDPRVGVYVSSPRGFLTNTFFIEGPEGVVLVDTQFTPSDARRALEEAERRTGRRVTHAVVLHPNPDKFNGTATFQGRGVEVITSAQVAALIPEVDALRRTWFYERYAPDYPEDTPAPSVFGDQTVTLDLAGLSFRVHVLGPGCSGAHVVLEFEGNLFVGDLVANGHHSWLEIGKSDAWLERLEELSALGADRVHPGRGPSGGPELLRRERTYLRRVQEIVAATEPRSPAPEGTFDRLTREVIRAFPDLGHPIFLRVGLPAEYRRQAKAAAVQ